MVGIYRGRFTAPKYLGSMVRGPNEPGRPDVMNPPQSALQVRGLTKRFDRLAVDALDLTVHCGEFYALLGPNGAGKTTTLRMISGLLLPDRGSIEVFGVNVKGALLGAKAAAPALIERSEERRVGKECTVLCRSRWSPYH